MINPFEPENKAEFTIDNILNDADKYCSRIQERVGKGDYMSALFLIENIGGSNIDKSPLYFGMAYLLQQDVENVSHALAVQNDVVKNSEFAQTANNERYNMLQSLLQYCLGKSEKYRPKTTE